MCSESGAITHKQLARVVWSGLAWHAKDKPYCKGSCAVGAVELSCMCTTLAERREFPEYRWSADQSQFGGTDCQRVRALAPDTQVEQRFLQALQPDQLTLALAALAHLEQEEQAENKQWELRLERARDLAKRAERQYQAVEPENRLVARQLPKQWEERLRAVETVEKEYHAWKVRRFGTLTQADREAIVALGSDFPAHRPRRDHHQYGAQADAAPGDSRGHHR
jgi:hypothetical protein